MTIQSAFTFNASFKETIHMQNNSTSHLKNTLGDDENRTPEKRPFMETLLQNSPGKENSYDYNWPTRHKFLEREISARVGTSSEPTERMSGFYVLQTAAERYFMVISEAIESMSEMFTEPEFGVMLNTTCSPIWEWDRYSSLATFVADDNGIERVSELGAGSSLGILLEKLASLSTTQNAALVDVCERVWRDSGEATLVQRFEAMGLRIASTE